MVTVLPREEWQCQYRGGHCGEPRAVKDDGTLHHLCPEHRHRANLNQRRSQERRRRMRIRLLEAAVATKKQALRSARSSASKRRSEAAMSSWQQVAVPDTRQDFEDDGGFSGMTLMSDSELFAPLMAEFADPPLLEDVPQLMDDLFRMIGPDVLSAHERGGAATMQ